MVVAFHQQQYRPFKAFYLNHVKVYWQDVFSGLPSYNRFVEWMASLLLPLCVYLQHCFGACSGISFMDATSLKVCHNPRIRRHRGFEEITARGKASQNLCGLVLWLQKRCCMKEGLRMREAW